MLSPLTILAAITLLCYVLFSIDMGLGSLSIRRLGELAADGSEWPAVSIVIAGRDEERNIEQALRTVLTIDYAPLEIIFVDDRSTDGTAAVVRRLAATDSRLRLVSVTTLPDGWLGKNHALMVGTEAAKGEWLAFTDADIIFEPTSLRRAVRYATEQHLDHLTAGAEVSGPTLPLRLFITAFAFFFMLYSRPWRARKGSKRSYVGIGAFNLLRASFYRSIGGHAPIAMRPDDDMMLGKLVKKHDGRQELVGAVGMIRVEWYATLAEAVRGLEKNAFCGLHYSITLLILGTLAQLATCVWPWVAMVTTHGTLRTLNIAIVVLTTMLVGAIASKTGGRFVYALGFPLVTIVFLYALWNSAIKAVRNDGIDWRGTHYPLRALRANKV